MRYVPISTVISKCFMNISVLYIQHCGVFGGSSRSLLELIKAFPEHAVNPRLIIPRGSSKNAFNKVNIELISTIGITQYGYYSGYRWLAVFREILFKKDQRS